MSALRQYNADDFNKRVRQLNEPWQHILLNVKSLTLHEIIELICKATHLNVSGVYYNNRQFTFKHIAPSLEQDKASLFKALYGLAITLATGVIHQSLVQNIRNEWVIEMLHIPWNGSPAFVFACQQHMQTVMAWMISIMNKLNVYTPLHQIDSRGNTPLHFAVVQKKWDWVTQLIEHGCSPYIKNDLGKTPIMLTAPYYNKLKIFKAESKEWFDALHETIVDGKEHAMWCHALLDAGADVNQSELYNSPVDSLIIFAQSGMDMNLPGTLSLTVEQNRILFMYGKIPTDWDEILYAFQENDWIRMLHAFFNGKITQIPEEYRKNVLSRQCVTNKTFVIQSKIQNM